MNSPNPEAKKLYHKCTLYWSLKNAPSRSLKSLLENGKCSEFKYEDHDIDLKSNEKKAHIILALNPRNTIPYIVYNGEMYTESASTLRFISTVVESLN
jgi:glutathione S-transferase